VEVDVAGDEVTQSFTAEYQYCGGACFPRSRPTIDWPPRPRDPFVASFRTRSPSINAPDVLAHTISWLPRHHFHHLTTLNI
jgi:hypothetical protein